MKSRRTSICLFLLVLSSTIVPAQKLYDLLDHIPFQLSDKISVLPTPALSFTPETNWSIGLSIIGTMKSSAPEIPLSTIQLDLRYTLNKQMVADVDYHWNSPNKKITAFGSNSLYHYPNLYFSNDDKSLSELIQYQKIEFDNKVFFNLRSTWKLGLIHRIQIINKPQSGQDDLFLSEMPTGYLGGLSHGVGFGLLNDQRNNSLNPANDSYFLNINLTTFMQIIGSDFKFTRIDFDARKYVPIFGSHTLALQSIGILNTGSPPFTLSGNLGGQSILRGFHREMYIDRQMLALQAELRIKIYKRIGAVGFIGLGSVSAQIFNLIKETPKASGGVGFRFLLDKVNNANLRFDVAYGGNGLQYYFSYGEAF